MSKNTNLSFLTDYITADITNGRIGINNASPTVAFDVVGATKITGVLTLTSTISNGTYAYTLPSATGTLALTSALSGTTNYVAKFTSSSGIGNSQIFDNGTNVGIGTSAPNRTFEVATGSDTYSRVSGNRGNADGVHVGNVEFYNSFSSILVGEVRGITGTGGTQSASGQLAFYTNNAGTYAERMRIFANGNVGIGTSSPGLNLAVQGLYGLPATSGAQGTGIFRVQDSASNIALDMGVIQNAGTWIQSGNKANSAVLPLALNPSGGNVLIGTTTDNGYKLNVNGQPGANGYTLWTNYSDRRLKENIQPLVNTTILDKINLLNPVTFNYNEASGYDDETRARKVSGFIAQELQEIFPEMVGTLKLNDEEYLDTNLSNLSLYLVKAVQELSTEINLLKQK